MVPIVVNCYTHWQLRISVAKLPPLESTDNVNCNLRCKIASSLLHLRFTAAKVCGLKENTESPDGTWKKDTISPNHFAPTVTIPGDPREQMWYCNQLRNVADTTLNSISGYECARWATGRRERDTGDLLLNSGFRSVSGGLHTAERDNTHISL